MYYTITNNLVQEAPASTPSCADFRQYLSNLSPQERKALGYYSSTVQGYIDTPTADPENDQIIIPFPTPEELEAELNRQKEVDAINQLEILRQQKIEALRQKYKDVVYQFCVLANIEIVTKFEDATTVIDAVQNAGIETQSQLFMLSVLLKQILDELRRPSMDGDDAWDRII